MENTNVKQYTARSNPHQATCQGLFYKYWWPKINTLVIVKPKRKALVY